MARTKAPHTQPDTETDNQPDTTGQQPDNQPDNQPANGLGLPLAYLKALDSKLGIHTAKAIAQACGVDESTIRNRWHPKVVAAIGGDRAKVGGRYTDLAEGLFRDYGERCHQGHMPSACWEINMGEAFAVAEQAPQPVAVEQIPTVTTTVVPDQPSSALVTNNQTMGALDIYMERLSNTIADLSNRQGETLQGIAEADQAQFLQEVEAAMLQGQKEGVILHAAKQTARNATMQQLNQQALEAKSRLGE